MRCEWNKNAINFSYLLLRNILNRGWYLGKALHFVSKVNWKLMPTFVTILQKDVRTGAFVRVSSSGRCVNIPGSLLHSQSESRNLRLCADPVIPPLRRAGSCRAILDRPGPAGAGFRVSNTASPHPATQPHFLHWVKSIIVQGTNKPIRILK